MIHQAVKENEFMGLKYLLGQDNNGTIRVTKTRSSMKKKF